MSSCIFIQPKSDDMCNSHLAICLNPGSGWVALRWTNDQWQASIALDLLVLFKLWIGVHAGPHCAQSVQVLHGQLVHIAPSEPMTSIVQQGTRLGSCSTFPSLKPPLKKKTLCQILSGGKQRQISLSGSKWGWERRQRRGYSAFPKAPALLGPHHRIVECHKQENRWESLTPLQICSQYILQS